MYRCVILAAWTAVSLSGIAFAQSPEPLSVRRTMSLTKAQTDAIDAAHLADAQKLINGGIEYLLSHQDEGGGWSMGKGANKPAVTALVLKALMQHPDFNAKTPAVAKGLAALMEYRQKDGGFYAPKTGLENYTTALAVMALVAMQDPQYNDAIRDAVAYMKRSQIVPGSESPDGDKITEEHPMVGGVSYGSHGRPDLSNVGFWMEALHEAGVKGDDPAFQRALVFLERTQNRSESNKLQWAAAGTNDGGFVYAPALKGKLGEGESKAGVAGPENKGLRSYGSMTYTGFKSMLYAGVDRKDPRVVSAFDWIRRYWRLDSNPNMPQAQSRQGLYYYYHMMAKALRTWGEPTITDAEGKVHNWRQELIAALKERVGPDGSWTNDADRWHEGNPNLVTAYVVLTLQEALKK